MDKKNKLNLTPDKMGGLLMAPDPGPDDGTMAVCRGVVQPLNFGRAFRSYSLTGATSVISGQISCLPFTIYYHFLEIENLTRYSCLNFLQTLKKLWKPHLVQNAVARVLTGTSRQQHITPVLW